jgi:hypothetical protein
MLTVLPPTIKFEFIAELQRLWIIFDEVTEYDPSNVKDLLGVAPPDVGD